MNTTLKNCLFKFGASALLVGTMATTLLGGGHTAFAAACAPGTEVVFGVTPGNDCTVILAANNPTGVLSFESDAKATVANGGGGIKPTFSFSTTVTDDRGIASGAWHLGASSTGLTSGGNSVDPTIDSVNSGTAVTGSPITGSSATCTDGTPLTSSAALSTSPTLVSVTFTSASHCSYAFPTSGTIDFTNKPAGYYSGDITLTLYDVA